jgi:alkanesulfonate monooxygenase SsuD/methylene tetrahydromethanopterin reductase-like flavin-dependent oxidoreductase (luciferase family)
VRTSAEKVEALEEGLAVIRGVWAESPFTYQGRHYRNEAGLLEPKPSHRIPIWLGTYGRRALEVTGRVADGWIPSMGPLPVRQVPSKMEIVRRAAERAGRDPDSLDYAYNVSVRVGGPPADDPDRRVTGEPDEIAERLLELLDLGFTVLNFWVGGRRDEQQERLASEVVVPLRQLG